MESINKDEFLKHKALSQEMEFIKPFEGRFIIEEVKDGVTTTLINDKNIVVNGGFLIMANLLAYSDENYRIKEIRLGKGGYIDGVYQVPSNTDASLYDQMFTFSITTFEIDPIRNILECRLLVESGQGIGPNNEGSKFTEAGLFAANGTMFSRKVFPELQKTIGAQLIIRWQLAWHLI